MATKRINLSFSMDRENDAKVYHILYPTQYKLDYVIKAVLSYMEKRDKDLIRNSKTGYKGSPA